MSYFNLLLLFFIFFIFYNFSTLNFYFSENWNQFFLFSFILLVFVLVFYLIMSSRFRWALFNPLFFLYFSAFFLRNFIKKNLFQFFNFLKNCINSLGSDADVPTAVFLTSLVCITTGYWKLTLAFEVGETLLLFSFPLAKFLGKKRALLAKLLHIYFLFWGKIGAPTLPIKLVALPVKVMFKNPAKNQLWGYPYTIAENSYNELAASQSNHLLEQNEVVGFFLGSENPLIMNNLFELANYTLAIFGAFYYLFFLLFILSYLLYTSPTYLEPNWGMIFGLVIIVNCPCYKIFIVLLTGGGQTMVSYTIGLIAQILIALFLFYAFFFQNKL